MRALLPTELLLQKLLNRFSRLTRPVLILDECETHVALAQRPEPNARRYGNQRLFQQQLREFE